MLVAHVPNGHDYALQLDVKYPNAIDKLHRQIFYAADCETGQGNCIYRSSMESDGSNIQVTRLEIFLDEPHIYM